MPILVRMSINPCTLSRPWNTNHDVHRMCVWLHTTLNSIESLTRNRRMMYSCLLYNTQYTKRYPLFLHQTPLCKRRGHEFKKSLSYIYDVPNYIRNSTESINPLHWTWFGCRTVIALQYFEYLRHGTPLYIVYKIYILTSISSDYGNSIVLYCVYWLYTMYIYISEDNMNQKPQWVYEKI